jgi:hypothetical protein
MTSEQELLITSFIENNNLTFEQGLRNTQSTIIIGYALYIGIKDCYTLYHHIKSEFDFDFMEEFEKIFFYARRSHYEKYWDLPSTHDKYVY